MADGRFKAGQTAEYMGKEFSLELLRDTFEYKNGELIWKAPPSNHLNLLGKSAGSVTPKGYVKIQFLGKPYKRHQLIYFYHHGKFARPLCDHINRNRSDDRIENLRELTVAQNNRNNTKVSVRKTRNGKYQARLSQKVIGTFDTIEDATQACLERKNIEWLL